MLIPIVSSSISYTPKDIITENSLTISELNITPDNEYFVYEVAPANHRIITATLKGSLDFVPRLEFWNPRTKKTIFRDEKSSGETASFTYTAGTYHGEPAKYYLIVDTYKNEGQTFTLNFQARSQNDAGLGFDASDFIRKGDLIKLGNYEGHLGEGDNADYYDLEIAEGETLFVNLTPSDNLSLELTITDGDYVMKFDRKTHLEGKTISEQYTSLKDQTITIGVLGTIPYDLDLFIPGKTVVEVKDELSIDKSNDSDKFEEDVSKEKLPMNDRPVTIKVYGKNKSEEDKNNLDSLETTTVEEDKSYMGYILIAMLIVVVILSVAFVIKKKKS